MEALPSLVARLVEFGAALVGNAFGAWGVFSALTPILAEFVGAFMPDRFRAWAKARLPSTPAHRRAVFVATGALLILIAAFQAFDEVNGKLRAAQEETAKTKAELAQLKSSERRQQESAEITRREILVSTQLGKFVTKAADLWSVPVGRDDYARWVQHCDAFVADVTEWVEENLGSAAKEKLLATVPFPKLPGGQLVDPSQRDRLILLDSISHNAIDLLRDFAANPTALNPAALPSVPSPPLPATRTRQ